MIGLIATSLLAATPVAQPPEGTEPPIVVIARKLDNWRGDWRINKGAFTCRTTRSSGDRDVDAVGCQAIQRCIGPQVSALRSLSASKLRKDEKRRQMNALIQSSAPCMSTKRNEAIAELAARRSAR